MMKLKTNILLFFLLLNTQNIVSGYNNLYKNKSAPVYQTEIPEYSALCCRLGMIFCCDVVD